jgi:hypothetical protein
MLVPKHTLPRRTILRGMGATIGLPFLEAMLPAFSARGRAAQPVHRFQTFYVPNGMAMEYWTPKGEGAGFELSPILEPLAPYRDQMLVLSGIKASWNYIHAGASGSFLTGTPKGGKTEIEIFADVSMDQLLARHFASDTQVASLEMSMDAPANAGACTGNLSCVYTHTLSWRSATQPLPMEWNPRAVFERLFGDSGSTDPAARRSRIQQDKSVLDSVIREAASLKGSLGPGDGVKLVEYLDAIRDVERRIQRAEEQSGRELPLIDHPAGAPDNYDDHVKLMCDLQVLAYQADLTRVITFMLGREFSGVTYPQIGVPDAHHPITHHQQEPEKIVKVAKINAYQVTKFAYLLDRLSATPDGDGTLLDHCTLLYGTGMGDCNAHDPRNIPLLLAGGGAGQLKGGRHIRYPKETPLANLHLTLLDKFGVKLDRIGDSTGRLDARTLAGI